MRDQNESKKSSYILLLFFFFFFFNITLKQNLCPLLLLLHICTSNNLNRPQKSHHFVLSYYQQCRRGAMHHHLEQEFHHKLFFFVVVVKGLLGVLLEQILKEEGRFSLVQLIRMKLDIVLDQLIEALGVDNSLGTFSMEQRRQFGREEDKTMWKAQVNSKLDCMGIEMKMFRTIVYGMFLIQLLSMVVFESYAILQQNEHTKTTK
ncbi:hypothetical protein HKD37_07G020173 [Glycine soja]